MTRKESTGHPMQSCARINCKGLHAQVQHVLGPIEENLLTVAVCAATEDPCQYAFDGTCDVPEHCSEGDFHDCGTSGESKQESATTATKATATKATATKDEQEPVKQEEGTSGGTSTAASDASSTVLFWGCQILVTTILSLHNVA